MTLNILPARVVLNGISRYYSTEKIESSFQGKLDVPYRFDQSSPYSLEDFALNEMEMNMVRDSLAGGTIHQTLEKSRVGKSRTYQILYTLFFLGILRFEK